MILAKLQLVEIANGEVGVHETGGNNCGFRIREYQAATELDPAPWPWCAAFVCWAIRMWLTRPVVREALSLRNEDEAENWRPKIAAAFKFETWARKRGLKVLPETARAKAGDLVIFDFSHIGIIAVDQTDSDYIDTIEGNTNGRGDRDSEGGDGVWRKRRPAHLAKCYIRIMG